MDTETLKRFQAKYTVLDNGCWQWHAWATHDGYGKMKVERRECYAHRLSYEHFVGPIPDGFVVDHLCKNTSCVNPAHLEPVTQRENLLRGEGFPAAHAKTTHCPQGHAYTDENTYRRYGLRYCKTCLRQRAHIYKNRVKPYMQGKNS